jgi:diguanylate cyclase (GGDEF)-like protein
MQKKLTLSYSKINMYLTCPRRYKFSYVDGLSAKFKRDMPYLSMGESVHSTLHKFFNLPVEKRSFEQLQHLLKRCWLRKGYKDLTEERDYGHKALDILENFYNNFDSKIKPVLLEKFFSIEDTNFRLCGKIDRVDKLDNDEYEVIDYKTGNYVPSEEEVQNDLQMKIYGLGVKNLVKTYPQKCSFIFLLHNEKISIELNEEILQETKNIINDTALKIANDEIFEPKKNQFCHSCDFAQICPLMNPTISDDDNLSGDDEIDTKRKLERIVYEKEKAVEGLYLMNNAIQSFMKEIEKEQLQKKILEVFSNVIQSKYAMLLTPDYSNEIQIFHSVYLKDEQSNILFNSLKKQISSLDKSKPKIINKEDCPNENFWNLLKIEQLLLLAIVEEETEKLQCIIVLSDKNNGAKYSDNEIIFLKTLSSQAATALKNASLYELTITDELTRIFNKKYFKIRLKEEISRAKRYKLSLTLLFLDIDKFKNFNDNYGHQTGDIVLKQFANILKKSSREIDIAARYGGEEFVIILPETNLKGAMVLAEKIRKNIADKDFTGHSEPLKVTTSIGISEFTMDDTMDTFIEKSDKALYTAKNNGRNRIEIFT